MNLEESNSFVEKMERNNKKKRTIKIILIICILLIIVLVAIMEYMKYLDSQQLKVYIDNKEVSFSNKFIVEQQSNKYINIKELSDKLGYSYQKGEYKNYTEDVNSCYLRTDYEIVSMTADKGTATKYLLSSKVSSKNDTTGSTINNSGTDLNNTTNSINSQLIVTDEETGNKSLNIVVDSENETSETIYINKAVKYIDGELYIPFSEVYKIFNISIDTNTENRVYLYSLNSLIASGIQYSQKLGYKELSNIYENLTAIPSNMLVVGDGKNYGVVDISTGKELISLKYEKIVYVQSTDEFLVTAEGSVGIVSAKGETIIKPKEYESISVLDEKSKLYLVKKDKKYGVLNGSGDIIVYCEYDSIGVENPEDFQKEGIDNFSLLFDELIPVNVDNKTGLIDKEGNEIFKPVYNLGYVTKSKGESAQTNTNTTNTTDISNMIDNNSLSNTTNTNTSNLLNTTNSTNAVNNTSVKLDEHDNVLTIPEETGIKGVVIRNYNNLYGIYDLKSKGFIPCSFTKIYSRTKSGVTTYYLEYNEQEIELSEYLSENGFDHNTKNTNSSGNTENTVKNAIE